MLNRSRLLLTLVLAPVAGNVQAFGLTDTTTALTVTSGGSPVTEVNSGTAITFTATVTAANVHVTRGTVNFCDTTVAHCTDVHVVATAQLTSAGTAIVSFVPGVGTHTYTAEFLGTASYKRSHATPAQLSVGSTAALPTTTSMTASRGVGGYHLTATVTGLSNTPGLPALTGSVTFAKAPGGSPFARAELTSLGTPSLSLNASYQALPGGNSWVAVADLNGDGKADLVIVGNAVVTILLGNGDGTFTAVPLLNYSCAGGCGMPIVADFNGDGIPDLAVGNTFVDGGAVVSGLNLFLGKGDGTFTALPETVTLTNDFAWTWVVGDFNGDGIPDLAAGGVYYGCWISLGNGDGTFTPPTTSARSTDATSLAVGDFNGDGIPDLALTGNVFKIFYSDVDLLLGKGDGTFTPAPTGPWLPYNPNSYIVNTALVAGDFNGDGLLDLAVAQSLGANDIVILLGQPGARFTQGATIPVAVGIGGILPTGGLSLGDFNGDGIPDLVVFTSNDLQIFLGKGDGTFVNAPGSPFTLGIGGALAVGNFDGGDLSDLAVGAQAYLTQFRETSVATATGVALPVSGTDNVTASYSGDANFAASTSNPLLLQSGPAETTITTLSATPKRTERGAVVNFTASVVDSKSQPVTVGSVSFYNGTTLLSTVELTAFLNGSSKAGTAAYRTRALPVGTSSLTAKFNGTDIDGPNTSAPETVTITGKYATATSISAKETGGDYTLTGTVAAYAAVLPTGDMKFVDTTANITLGSAALSASTSGFNLVAGARPATGSYPGSVLLADVNNDGKLDLIVGNRGNSNAGPTFTVFLGKGDGTYGAANNIGTNYTGVTEITVGDFNRDGKLDIAAAYSPGGNLPIVGIFLGNGDGTFGAETDYLASSYSSSNGTNASSITVGDFNHDGKLDLVMAGLEQTQSNEGSGVVTVLLGNGDGTFQAPQSLIYGSEPSQYGSGTPPVVGVGDFNGDGRLDVAVALSGGSYLTILVGNGDGTFKPGASYGTGLSTNAIAVADLNGDGKLDVVLATPEDTLTVWLGNGDGTLRPGVRVPAGPNSVSLAIGDLNGDGIPDMAVSNYGLNTVGLYVGNGDGTFQTPTTIRLYSPTALALGDVNNDGRLDIAAVSTAANNIAIFLNKLSVSATLTGVDVPGTGTQSIVGTYPGDDSFYTSTSKAVPISNPAP